MQILHLMVASDEEPLILMAEPDDVCVMDISQRLAVFVSKPFMESLHSESRRPKSDSDGGGRKPFV